MKRFVGILLLCACLGAMQFDQNTLQIIGVDPATSDSPRLAAVGDSSDINVEIHAKGAGNINVDTGGSFHVRTPAIAETKYTAFRVSTAAAAPVNNLYAAGATASSEPSIGAEGSDTDISIDLVPKGAGRIGATGILLTAGTTTVPPLQMTSGTSVTTPLAGAFGEYDGRNFFGSVGASTRGVLPVEYAMFIRTSNTLTSTTNEQALFDEATNGALTLPTGTYFFECVVGMSAMSATSGNLAFDILGAGTATLGTVLYQVTGIDGAKDTVAALSGTIVTAGQTPASLVTAATSTECHFIAQGHFRVTATGTIIPSGSLVTASAATMQVGSFFRCYSVGASNTNFVGPWS